MVYQRPDTGSLQQWADAVGDQSWTFDNMLPYFQRSTNFSTPGPSRFPNASASYESDAFVPGNGPLHVSYPNYANPFSTYLPDALGEIGIEVTQDFNSGSLFGSQWASSTIDPSTGFRSSSQTSFLEEAQARPNFKLFYLTMAEKILFDDEKTAIGVQIDSGITLHARREVIVSAGAFQSPQLLMVSGVGPAETLEQFGIPVIADRPGVGQNLTDHIFFGPSYRAVVPTLTRVLADPVALLHEEDTFYGMIGDTPGQGILSNPLLDYLGWEKAPSGMISNSTAYTLSKLPESWPDIEYMSLPGFVGNASGVDGPTEDMVTLLGSLVAPQVRHMNSSASP